MPVQKGGGAGATQLPGPISVTSSEAAVPAIAAENTATTVGGYAVSANSPVGIAVYGHSVSKDGVQGESQNWDGVSGLCHIAAHAGVSGTNDAGGFGLWAMSANGTGIGVYGKSDGGVGVQGESQKWDGVSGLCHIAAHAGVSGTNDAGGFGLWAVSENGSGIGAYGRSDGGAGVQGESQNWDGVVGLCHTAAHAGVSAQNDAGGYGLWAKGSPAGYFEGDAHVTGTLTVDVDIVLSNAADFAEEFDVDCVESAEPGTVMVLAEDGVQPCCTAYDRKVAGIVSGAGRFKPGIILDRRRAVGRPRSALALVGKVYCKVDASYGPIAIGDLLTTSPRLGHAMKAADQARSFGSTIGKALSPLADGVGMIPVLVALQ